MDDALPAQGERMPGPVFTRPKFPNTSGEQCVNFCANLPCQIGATFRFNRFVKTQSHLRIPSPKFLNPRLKRSEPSTAGFFLKSESTPGSYTIRSTKSASLMDHRSIQTEPLAPPRQPSNSKSSVPVISSLPSLQASRASEIGNHHPLLADQSKCAESSAATCSIFVSSAFPSAHRNDTRIRFILPLIKN